MERQINTSENHYGMVSTASKYATDAGVKMLEKGGNAIDAAAAAAFCLGVTEPQASGLGGQSMALIYFSNNHRIFALDGSSRAPFNIQPMKTPEKPIKLGITSTTVPSTPATIGYMHEKYGKLSLAEVLEPAIDAAENGFKVTSLVHRMLKKEEGYLRLDPSVVKNFFKDNEPARTGQVVQQPELAACLKSLAEGGWQDFYVGKVGQQIIRDMNRRGGLITAADLCQIPQPIEREVLQSSYRNYDIYTFPPPGAGRVLIQILNTLEGFPSHLLNPEDPIGASIFALAFRFALINRQRIPIHPDYYLQTVNKMMMDKGYGRELSERIKQIYQFALYDSYSPPPHSGETTHLSVVDADGNCVGITQSIELVFGSKTMADGLGFFYNNYMSAFEYKNMTHPYYLLPGSKPWSSVAPVLLFNNGQPQFLLGSPGSSRISTTLAQVISRLVDGKESLDKAIAAPRFHSSDTGHLQIEKKRFDPDVLEALHLTGFQLKNRGPYSFYLGCVQGVQTPERRGYPFYGVADPRRDGTAGGPMSFY